MVPSESYRHDMVEMNLLRASKKDRVGMTSVTLTREPLIPEFEAYPNEPERWTGPLWDLPGGYARAASLLMEAVKRLVLQTEPGADQLIPAYLFLWRHHFEVQLKSILELVEATQSEWKYGRAFGWEAVTGMRLPEGLFQDVSREHSLQRLWERVQPLTEIVWDREPHQWPLPSMTPRQVALLIKQFHDLDPNGDGVRYAYDARGNPTMLRVRRVDLEHAEKNMLGISQFLEWARSEIGAVMGVLPGEAEIEEALRFADSYKEGEDQADEPGVAE